MNEKNDSKKIAKKSNSNFKNKNSSQKNYTTNSKVNKPEHSNKKFTPKPKFTGTSAPGQIMDSYLSRSGVTVGRANNFFGGKKQSDYSCRHRYNKGIFLLVLLKHNGKNSRNN